MSAFKSSPLYSLVLGALIFLGSCTSRPDRMISSAGVLLDSLQRQYAPDRRIELWNLQLSKTDSGLLLDGEVGSREAYKAIVRSMDEFFPEIANHLTLLPEEAYTPLVNGLVNNSVAHFRREPSSRKELVTQALLGTPVRILKETDDKYLVQSADAYIGWTNLSEIRRMTPDEIVHYQASDKVIFTAQYGFSYTEADEGSLPVSDLVMGCILAVKSRRPHFTEVIYPDGRVAWVRTEEVSDVNQWLNRTAQGEDIVHTALGFHGIPYLWGGASSKALDCSGLVSNVYFMNGIQLPRDTDQQSECGRVLTKVFGPGNLEAGDLLFFGTPETDTTEERISHVAIYIGESEFIHAAGYRDRVSINSMNPDSDLYIPEYPAIFIQANRIIGYCSGACQPVVENKFYREILNIPQ